MSESHWFDELFRRLSLDAPRRGLLRAAGALAAGLVLAATPRLGEAKRKKGKGKGRGNRNRKGSRRGKGKNKPGNAPAQCGNGPCAGDQTCCPVANDPAGVDCVNTEIDPDNCGRCGRVCRQDQECFHGSCFCQGDYERDCDGRCIDVSADNNNCGGCNVVCAADRHCVEGNCLEGSPVTCPAGYEQCLGSTCINLKTHDSHCGRCFHPCFRDSAARHCVDGVCVPLTENDVHPCDVSGGGTVYVPKDWPCCNNAYGYCHEGARCTLLGDCVVE